MIARLSVVSVFLIAALVIAGYVVGGRPRAVYETARHIYGLAADHAAVYWLETDAGPAPGPGARTGALYRLACGARAPDCLYPEQQLSEFFPAGDHVLAIEVGGTSSALISLPTSGGQSLRLAEGLRAPAGLLEHDRQAYWTETYAPKMEHIYHLPAAGSLTAVRSCPVSGEGPVCTEGALGGQPGGFAGRLLGVQPDSSDLLVLDRFGARWGGGWSAVRVVSRQDRSVRTTVLVRGTPNDALLDGMDLYWTAPSEDAGNPMGYRCIRRAPAPGSTEYETLTDWLPGFGRLVPAGGRILYGATGDVWLVPGRLHRPMTITKAPGDGRILTTLGGRLYITAPASPGEALCRVPESVVQRLMAAVGMG